MSLPSVFLNSSLSANATIPIGGTIKCAHSLDIFSQSESPADLPNSACSHSQSTVIHARTHFRDNLICHITASYALSFRPRKISCQGSCWKPHCGFSRYWLISWGANRRPREALEVVNVFCCVGLAERRLLSVFFFSKAEVYRTISSNSNLLSLKAEMAAADVYISFIPCDESRDNYNAYLRAIEFDASSVHRDGRNRTLIPPTSHLKSIKDPLLVTTCFCHRTAPRADVCVPSRINNPLHLQPPERRNPWRQWSSLTTLM